MDKKNNHTNHWKDIIEQSQIPSEHLLNEEMMMAAQKGLEKLNDVNDYNQHINTIQSQLKKQVNAKKAKRIPKRNAPDYWIWAAAFCILLIIIATIGIIKSMQL